MVIGYIICKILWKGGNEELGKKMKKGVKLYKKRGKGLKNASFWVINLTVILRDQVYFEKLSTP